MNFMKAVEKDLEKSGISVGKSSPPTYWISTGNYAQNKVISGSFLRGIPQGRITAFAGPSGAGKSFNVVNLMREAQQMGCYVVAIDTENALDDDFVQKLGVDTENDYTYCSVNTVGQCKKTVSNIIKGYKAEFEKGDPNADKLLIAIDSLNMMMTEAEADQFDKGELKGDMGQKNKQLKAMLQSFTNAIKETNITIIVTCQVYENPDFPMNGKPRYIFPAAVEYACSQIIMVTRLMLKDKVTKEVFGVRMKVEGAKTRFCKPFSSITMLVPYDEGMDPFSGLLEIAESLGLVTKKGAWYTHVSSEKKFQEKGFSDVQDVVLEEAEALANVYLNAKIGEDEVEIGADAAPSMKKQRKAKHDTDNGDT